MLSKVSKIARIWNRNSKILKIQKAIKDWGKKKFTPRNNFVFRHWKMTLFISYDFFILNITSLSYNNDSNPFSLAKWIRFLRLSNILIMMSWSISVAHFLILRILFWDIFWHISCSKHGTIMYCTILEFSESLFFTTEVGFLKYLSLGRKLLKRV